MVIYGVALLAACLLIGNLAGDLIGKAIGINTNVGGVGIAMLLLLFINEFKELKIPLTDATRSGITFWSAIYIPIVVAMAAQQNMISALSGGWLAIVAGGGAVVVGLAMVPLLTRMAR